MTNKTEDDLGKGIISCGVVILFFIAIIGLVLYWMITLPAIAIIIIIIYFKYRDKKEKGIDVTRLYKKKKGDWRTRMAELDYRNRQMKIQMIKDNNLDRLRQKTQPITCPNCNMELRIWNKCELCGWEKEICKREALGKKCFLKTDKNSCKSCGKYEKWDGEEHEKEKRSRTIPKHIQREVWRRDQGRCVRCDSQERLEFDHIIPFSKGGSNTARNIQLLCEKCNRSKSSKI